MTQAQDDALIERVSAAARGLIEHGHAVVILVSIEPEHPEAPTHLFYSCLGSRHAHEGMARDFIRAINSGGSHADEDED